jgi:hypothetical protein
MVRAQFSLPRGFLGAFGMSRNVGRVLLFIGLSTLAATAAFAETEIFSGDVTNAVGSYFALTIQKTGSKLRFRMQARSAQTSLEGVPSCDSAELKADGSFTTYCNGFGNGVAGSALRVQLKGTLAEARIDTVARYGSAEFKLHPGPLAKP